MGRYRVGPLDPVLMPARIAAALEQAFPVDRWRLAIRGRDEQADEFFSDFHQAAVNWRLAHGYEAEPSGTVPATEAEPASPLDGWCSVREAADRLRLTSTQAVHKHRRAGRLEGKQLASGRWRIRISSLDELTEARIERRTDAA